jgi:hypothetical protein
MSHSTHVGFSEPLALDCPTTLPRSGDERSNVPADAPSFQSRDFGVGQSFTAVCRFMPPCRFGPRPAPVDPFARGVGHIRSDWLTARPSSLPLGPLLRPSGLKPCGVGQMGFKKSRGDRPADRIAEALVFEASGVGNKPDPVSPVRGANGGSWNTVPPRIVPDRGQVSENLSKPSIKESCDVLHKDEAGSKLANEASVFTP